MSSMKLKIKACFTVMEMSFTHEMNNKDAKTELCGIPKASG